ncbi:MAG: hypothetical protein AAB586_01390 [Patescibacteria group bacterium]
MNDQFSTIRHTEIRFFLVLAIILSCLFIVSLIFNTKVERKDKSVPTGVAAVSFPPITIGAKAVYVYDLRTRTVLFAKNENMRLSLASLTKIMSALIAEDLSPLYGTVIVTEEALNAEGNSGLYKNEHWKLKDLLDFSLLTSSNDGVRAIALSLGALSSANATSAEIINDFVGEMNDKARELNLKNTYFWNETGLDESNVKGGAYGTAKDISTLLEYILTNHPAFFDATKEATTTFQSLDNHLHVAQNTNSLVAEIPGLMASKTGFTDTAGGNLAFVFDPELGRPIIVSILGASAGEGRFDDARVLVNAVMRYISSN